MLKNDQKEVFTKMLVWIKEDRDSMTRPKSENVKKKNKKKNLKNEKIESG